MKKIRVLTLVVLGVSLVLSGCGSEQQSAENNGVRSKNKSEQSKKELLTKVDNNDLRIGDTAKMEMSVDQDYAFDFTLNGVSYSDKGINGFTEKVDYDYPGYLVFDVTVKNTGADITYDLLFAGIEIGSTTGTLYIVDQEEMGLHTFQDEEAILKKGDSMTGKVGIKFAREAVELVHDEFMSTGFTFNVDESEITDYQDGDQ